MSWCNAHNHLYQNSQHFTPLQLLEELGAVQLRYWWKHGRVSNVQGQSSSPTSSPSPSPSPPAPRWESLAPAVRPTTPAALTSSARLQLNSHAVTKSDNVSHKLYNTAINFAQLFSNIFATFTPIFFGTKNMCQHYNAKKY